MIYRHKLKKALPMAEPLNEDKALALSYLFLLSYAAKLRSHNSRVLVLSSALNHKLDFAVDQREQGVILAHADVFTWVHLGAALANNDAACVDYLATVNFDAQSFRLGIATIARGAAAFFVCHLNDSLYLISPTSD